MRPPRRRWQTSAVTDGHALLGRQSEFALFDDLCANTARGGGAVLMEGDPGVGKSALLDALSERAAGRGLRVLSATGTHTESALSFSGLHLLLHPLRGRIADLPAPQRNALETAFGIRSGQTPTVFLAGVATMTLLAESAAERPILLTIDDVHWLDPASRAALLLALRRLRLDPVVTALTIRSGERIADEAGLRRITLAPLRFADANVLLDRRADPPRGTARRALLDIAGGNPLALVELAAPESFPDDPRTRPTLVHRLERVFLGRFHELDAPARITVLTAALGDRCTVTEILAAATATIGAEPTGDWLAAPVALGLVVRDSDMLRFRHPLVRSAVLSACDPLERDRVLASLIEVVGADSPRSLWWRVELTPADDDLADEVDELAARSVAAEDPALALRALAAAAELTTDVAQRQSRQLRAAELAVLVGAHEAAAAWLTPLRSDAADPSVRARAAWQWELLPLDGSALAHGDLQPALEAIETIRATGDIDRAVAALTHLAAIAWDRSADAQPGAPLSAAIADLRLGRSDPRLLLLLAVSDPEVHGDEVARRIRGLDLTGDDPERLWQLGYALNLCGDIDVGTTLLRRAAVLLRERSRGDLVPHALMALSWMEFLSGDFTRARADIDEVLTIAADRDDLHLGAGARAARAWFDAIDGVAPDRAAIAGSGPALPPSRIVSATTAVAEGMAAHVSGHPARALAALDRVADPADPAYHRMFAIVSAPDAVEAALHLGRRDHAAERAAYVEETARRWRAPVVGAVARYLQLALDDALDSPLNDGARSGLVTALDEDPIAMPYLQARARLLVGARLRRNRQPSAARPHLHAALDGLVRIGATAWAERCREELRATGERLPGAPGSGRHVLTPQELRVAEAAAEGLTNRAIAQRLFISPRTVDAHLYSAFRKLGISERRDLENALRTA